MRGGAGKSTLSFKLSRLQYNNVLRHSPFRPTMEGANVHQVDLDRSAFSKTLWFALGLVFMSLGLIGIPVPGLPTTPFMILAAACFARSSQKFYDWIINNKMFGHHVRNYREGNGIPANSKKVIIPTLWVFVIFAVLFGIPEDLLFAKATTLILAVIGTIFILGIPNSQVLESRMTS